MIARVRGVIAALTRSRSMFRWRRSTSTNTGRAPTSRIELAVAAHESGVVITSSPGPTPARRRPRTSAAVPELNVRTGRPPQYAESAASNRCTSGPEVIQPERSTAATPAIVSSSITGRAKGRNSAFILAPRHDEHAEDDDADPDEAQGRYRLAEQIPSRDRVDDVADREHRVGDAHLDARQRHDPDHDADDIAGETAEDVRLGRQLEADRHRVRGAEFEAAHRVGPGLEQELRRRVEQHTGEKQEKARYAHGFLTITRRGSDATTFIGRPRRSSSAKSRGVSRAKASRSARHRSSKLARSGMNFSGVHWIDFSSSSG